MLGKLKRTLAAVWEPFIKKAEKDNKTEKESRVGRQFYVGRSVSKENKNRKESRLTEVRRHEGVRDTRRIRWTPNKTEKKTLDGSTI